MDNREKIKAYYQGLKEGVRMFAWWKDGVQYVGTCGTTLKEALKEVDEEELGRLSKIPIFFEKG
jgi:hypothetical protein